MNVDQLAAIITLAIALVMIAVAWWLGGWQPWIDSRNRAAEAELAEIQPVEEAVYTEASLITAQAVLELLGPEMRRELCTHAGTATWEVNAGLATRTCHACGGVTGAAPKREFNHARLLVSPQIRASEELRKKVEIVYYS